MDEVVVVTERMRELIARIRGRNSLRGAPLPTPPWSDPQPCPFPPATAERREPTGSHLIGSMIAVDHHA
jgi:hypothetical protein